MQIYTNKDTDRKLEEIKTENPNFNASEEFRKLIYNIYSDIWTEDLGKLRKKQVDILEREKQIWEEKKSNEEKIREAEKREPERKRIEEKKRQRKEREYNTRFFNLVNSLTNKFEINKQEAEELVKEYLSSPELIKKRDITEFAIKDGYRLNRNELLRARDDLDVHKDYLEIGYKF